MEIKLTTNFTPSIEPKIGFIIHGTLGNYEGAVDWLYQPCFKRNPVSYSSAHYIIAKDGRCTQLVLNKDIAWHAGITSNPTPEALAVLPKTLLGGLKNPNNSFIGIELEWFVGDVITEEQYAMVSQIIATSGVKNPIILCHKQITDYKSDFMTSDGKIDMLVVNEIKRRIIPTPAVSSKEDIKKQIINLINQL